MRGSTVKFIDYCYIDVNGTRKVKTISDERGNGSVGYKIDNDTLRVWISSDEMEQTWVFPLRRVEYIREILKSI